jgi:CRP/FNR family cyclic AMP-dependent transcriptional regulator
VKSRLVSTYRTGRENLTHMHITTSLRVIALFDEMSDAELARVSESCSTFSYRKNAEILSENDRTDDVFFILAGAVRINSISAKGREVIYSDCTAGNIFGEFSAIDGLPRSASVVAVSDCVVELLHSNAPVATKLVELLVAKIRRTSQQVFEVAALSLRERLRRELLRMAAAGRRVGRSVIIKPAPTHQEIASHLGSHREAVTREFHRLELDGLVEVRRRQICILDPERLKKLHM